MIDIDKVLVATDFGDTSDAALFYGRDLARLYGARLHVLHVVDDGPVFSADLDPAAAAEAQKASEQAARAGLESLLTTGDRLQLHARAIVRSSNDTALAIVDYANESGIDLIVMGTHGRTGLAHVVMGSVAEKVVRTALCPVLTIHAPQRKPVSDAVRVPVRVERIGVAIV
jgi:nucleotide-binding universal stress UspA family protein